MKGSLEIYDLVDEQNAEPSTPFEKESELGFPLSPLPDWLLPIPGRLVIPQEFLSDSSFSIVIHPTPSVEVEVIVHYPVARLHRYIDNLPLILDQLRKLGPEGGGFEFGYDILPEEGLEDPNDINIFTGSHLI